MVIVPEVIQGDGSYALIVEFASGIVSPAVFDTINDIIKEEGARVHLTTSQKMMILDLTASAAQRARVRLDGIGAAFKLPKRFYQPRVCVGSRYCTLGLQDTLGFANQVSKKYSGIDIPYKLKIGISGCRASCAHSTISDIGFIGQKSGYICYVGGRAGTNPLFGRLLEDKLTDSQSLDILGKVVSFYKENYEQKTKSRLVDIIEKAGFDRFRAFVVSS